MSRYARLLNEDHHDQQQQQQTDGASPFPSSPADKNAMSNVFASLKESASKASDSVRSGLGIPAGNAPDDSDAQSEASSMIEEVSEFCPKLTFHQVRGYCC